MTREEKIKAFEMRMDGATLRQIGNELGVTCEYIRQVLYQGTRTPKGFTCLYPGLKGWMRKNNVSVPQFIKDIKIFNHINTFYHKAKGKSDFTLHEVKAILAYTGMTFEEAFGREESPGSDVAKEEAYAAD